MSRIKDLTHYVISIDKHNELGATTLNKVLWYADIIHYAKYRKSLSGEEYYVKQRYGPVVKNMLSILSSLEAEKKISIEEEEILHIYRKKKYTSISECEISLSGKQSDIVNNVFSEIAHNYTATKISEKTHGIIWQAVELRGEIPLYTVFASRPGVVTDDQITWAKACIRK